jgi:hypothetical protein
MPVVPSSMSNSSVLAFEGYEYEEADQYEQYATNMANDNYFKSQGSDFIKKIKCNNINSNFNGIEANIGTGDSLGLGVEFLQGDDVSANWLGNGDKNNGNFDLDCINNNNNNNEGGQGQVGPQGPPGPRGPEGSPGSFGDVTIVKRVANALSVEGNTQLIARAGCLEGETLISGGGSYSFLPPATAPTNEIRTWILEPNPGAGVAGEFSAELTVFGTVTTGSIQVTAFALCAS